MGIRSSGRNRSCTAGDLGDGVVFGMFLGWFWDGFGTFLDIFGTF